MSPEKNEAVTRKELIDKALEISGWSPIVPFSKNQDYHSEIVTEYETADGPADYILFDNSQAIAVVEAKKLGVGPQNILHQAQRYSRGFQGGNFNFNGYHLPFIYSTNGEIIWFQDLRSHESRSRQIKRFHTRSALREMLGRDTDASIEWLRNTPINN